MKEYLNELIGKNRNACLEDIKEMEAVGYTVNVMPEGSVVTRDYRLDRIRISYDNNDIITKASVG